jgi:hypothetical protein
MSFQHDYDDDYPIIPRNVPLKGKYWGMNKKEAIIVAINAAILIIWVFSQGSDAAGILRFLGSLIWILFLRAIFSTYIFGRVMYRYVQDLFDTLNAKGDYYFYEQRGNLDGGFTYSERHARDIGEHEEKEA